MERSLTPPPAIGLMPTFFSEPDDLPNVTNVAPPPPVDIPPPTPQPELAAPTPPTAISPTTALPQPVKNYHVWSKRENSLLKTAIQNDLSLNQLIAQLPDRPVAAIESKYNRWRKRFKSVEPQKPEITRPRAWTIKEDEQLKFGLLKYKNDWNSISENLLPLRKPDAIKRRVQKLQQKEDAEWTNEDEYDFIEVEPTPPATSALTQPSTETIPDTKYRRSRPWTPDELALLKEVDGKAPDPRDIHAILPLRSISAIDQKMRNLAREPCRGSIAWSADEKALLERLVSEGKKAAAIMKALPNRTKVAIETRIWKLKERNLRKGI
jgi:hypothetical protein